MRLQRLLPSSFRKSGTCVGDDQHIWEWIFMRLRNIKGSREVIAANEWVIHDETACKGQWKKHFGSDAPIYIEIGTGKGQFIMELARRNPDKNFIGIEKYSSVLLRALEKRQYYEGNNLYFIRMDAEYIEDVFAKDEVAGIYLNFSDPWPKERHAKRRLTSRQYWNRYGHILKPDGRVAFKTDNRDLFTFSLEEVGAAGWRLEHVSFDLHQSHFCENNIMTEYEERFSKEGHPIHYMTAYNISRPLSGDI